MDNHTIVTLKKGEGRTIKSGGMWIFDNEIESIVGTFKNGDIVTVHDFDGYPMGRGFINQNSKIRVRLMTRNSHQEIDSQFLMNRVKDAWEYRKKTVDISSCRIVFGDADFLPGLVIDKFEDILVVQSLALGIDRFKMEIIDDIGEPFDTNVLITENGVKYIVDVENGQKTGFFLDQKYNRKSIWKLCKDAKVLDCFTHTGSFALNAGMAGAKSVLGVDASELAVQQATENAGLNGLENTVKFQCEDVFELLPRLEEQGELFDLVILDPPAFTKSKNSIKNAIKGYREINRRGIKLVKNGGYLATCSCSHFMDYETFTKTIGQAASNVHRRLKQVEFRTQAPDHPILWSADESYYLKFYIFQVVDEK